MDTNRSVAFHTLGCKLNFSETSTLSRQLEKEGFEKKAFTEKADIYVINTCSVTENADKECRQLVRRIQRLAPESFVVITGCYAQLKPKEIASIPGVDMVLGANEKFNILEHLEKESSKRLIAKVAFDNIKETKEFVPSYSFGDRTRSFLKIQDGCDYFCSFCTIPLARGKSRNASIKETVSQAEKIAATDVKEVVLTGVNIGDFGQGEKENFYGLIQELDEIKDIERFRISSIEPNLLSNEIIDFCLSKSKRFAPHFHIPLQSGSDRLLKLMRRKYERKLYAERVARIKSLRKDSCIGVDVIVGFPGESDEDFNETIEFIKDLDVSYLHVFTYSERANTGAPKLGAAVPMEVRRTRSKKLHLISDRKKRNFYTENLNTERIVLFEYEEDEGYMFGFTENYIKVKFPFDAKLTNTFQRIRLTEIDRDGIMKCSLSTEF